MSLSSVVNVTITSGTRQVSQAGFGTPIVTAYHTKYVDRVRTYSDITGLTADGFVSTDEAYQHAQAVFSQSPRPPTLKLGRRASAPSHVFDLIPTITTQGYTYSLDVWTSAGYVTVTYTNGASETVATICDALQPLLDALSSIACVDNTTKLTCTGSVAGRHVDITNRVSGLRYIDTSTDPGLAADLDAFLLADPDFYGLALDSSSKAEISVAAAWAETKTVLFVCQSADWDVKNAAQTTDTFSTLKGLDYARTAGIFNEAHTVNYAGAAALGDRLPAAPGSDTWQFKGFSGVVADTLTETEMQTIENKSGNYYITLAGVSNLQGGGKVFAGEYIDIVRGIDWTHARIQERVFGLFVNSEKVPFTDTGVGLVVSEVEGQLKQGVDANFLAGDPAPIVTAPKVRDVSAANKRNRLLPDVRFGATVAGAIHATNISGLLSV